MSKELVADFTKSAQEEVERLESEIRLSALIEDLQSGKELSPTDREKVLALINFFVDLFNPEAPTLSGDPQTDILTASRDINLSRLLREKGIFRLFILMRTKNHEGKFLYAELLNKTTGEIFERQEDLITWFCTNASVSRALVFKRIRMIERLMFLGQTIEETFKTIIKNPSAVEQTIKLLGSWEKDTLINVSPPTAKALADKYLKEDERDYINDLLDECETDDGGWDMDADDMENYLAVLQPAIREIVEEVSDSEHVREIMDWVRHDIIGKPEIEYSWDMEYDCLVVTVIIKEINERGFEYVSNELDIPLIPDILNEEFPKEAKVDLIKRLPIKNRKQVEDTL